jgi:hypothetical protein
MKMMIACALGVAFVAALGLGLGCNSSSYDNSPPPQNPSLDGKTYTEKYTCNEIFGAPPLSCPDLNVTDVINFQSTGGNTFEGRDVPDTGYVYTGTLSGTTLTWTATSPLGYTESGTWTFSASFDSFSGSSHYEDAAVPPSYSGDCNTNGVLAPGTPSDPPLPSGCP